MFHFLFMLSMQILFKTSDNQDLSMAQALFYWQTKGATKFRETIILKFP